MRLVKAVCCAIALTAFLAPGARADEWNKKTILTFSGPVQIPGATLAAGTYVFKLADLNGNRHVVQVFDKDEKHIYGTILAIPDKRLQPTDDPVVMFAERPAGTPQAIRAWFYPGDTFGDEFVYPKSQAVRIAKASHQSVLATDDNAKTSDNEAMKSAKVGRVDENGKMAEGNESTNTASTTTADTSISTTTAQSSGTQTPAAQQNKPSGATASTTATTSNDAKLKNSSGRNARNRSNAARAETGHTAVGTSGQATANQPNTGNRARLPKTASNLSLFELLSAFSLAGAFGVRLLRARFAGAR